MDWNKTKNLFIVVFLVLDIFLVYQFLDYRSAKLKYNKETTSEEQLKADNITYPTLPVVTNKENMISGKPKEFNEKDFKASEGQTISIVNKTTLHSNLSSPIKLGSGDQKYTELENFMKKDIFAGEKYQKWGKSKDGKKLIYYQVYNGKVLFNNSHAMIEFTLNENNEVLFYHQTFLEKIEEFKQENQDIIPLKAIMSLYSRGYLPQDSKITTMELGYYTLIKDIEASQSLVLVPTWHIRVNGEEDYFVNAIESQVLTIEDKLTE